MLKRLALLVCLLAPSLSNAEVVSVDVTSRQPWVAGQAFGNVGAYEVLRGTVHYAIDPRSKAARDVIDIGFAPVNARGLVEYSGPFVMIRPVDATRGNHTTLIEVANRGRTQMDGSFFETEEGLDLMAPDDVKALADTTFFKLGYSLAWVGWQARMEPDEFGLQIPVAPVHSQVRATFAADEMMEGHNAFDLPANGFYCAQDAQQEEAVLRLQTRFDDPGTVVPRGAWHFAATSKNKDARCSIALGTPAASSAYFSLV